MVVVVMVVVVEAVEVGSILRIYVVEAKLTCPKGIPARMRHQFATAVGKFASQRSASFDFDSITKIQIDDFGVVVC